MSKIPPYSYLWTGLSPPRDETANSVNQKYIRCMTLGRVKAPAKQYPPRKSDTDLNIMWSAYNYTHMFAGKQPSSCFFSSHSLINTRLYFLRLIDQWMDDGRAHLWSDIMHLLFFSGLYIPIVFGTNKLYWMSQFEIKFKWILIDFALCQSIMHYMLYLWKNRSIIIQFLPH